MAGRYSVDAVFRAIDRMTAPINKMQSRMSKFVKATETGIKSLDKAADKWLAGLTRASVGLSVAAAASTAALAAAAQPGMEFEQQIANLGAAYLKTRDQIAPLEKEALRLGAATQFSATDVAGALESMAKAGFSEEQALAGIEGMTYAAAAAGEDLVQTSAAIGAVMKGMGIETSQTTKVADLLALASVKTASSIGSLAESMSKVGPVARQLDIPLKDVVAMVASLQDAGLDASEAGSATATMLTMMASPSKAVTAQMKKLGISFKDATGNMKAPALVLGELVKAGKKAGGNMEQLAFFADLVGLRGQKAAINLKELFESGAYDKLVGELDAAAGTAKQMSDLRMSTLTGDIDKMTESVKTLAIDAYSVQSGGLRGIVSGMTEWIDKNREVIGQNVNGFFKTLADNFESIVTWIRRIGTVIAVITAASIAVKLFAGAVQILTWAMAANPMTLLIVGIVAALALILAFWPEIEAFFGAMWEGIVSIASSIGNAIGSAVGAIFDFYKRAWMAIFEFIVGLFTLIWRMVKPAIQPALDFILSIATTIYEYVIVPLGQFFAALWRGVSDAAAAAWQYIADGAKYWFDVTVAIWSVIGGVFKAIWDGIAAAFMAILGPVFDKIMWAIDKVRALGRATLGTDEGEGTPDSAAPMSSQPQVISPSDRIAQSISETTTTQQSEVTIRDTTGKATITKKPAGGGIGLRVAPSGAFR